MNIYTRFCCKIFVGSNRNEDAEIDAGLVAEVYPPVEPDDLSCFLQNSESVRCSSVFQSVPLKVFDE